MSLLLFVELLQRLLALVICFFVLQREYEESYAMSTLFESPFFNHNFHSHVLHMTG